MSHQPGFKSAPALTLLTVKGWTNYLDYSFFLFKSL